MNEEAVRTSFDAEALIGRPLIKPGGKLDPDAIREAIDKIRSRQDGEEDALPTVTFSLQRDLKARLDKYLTSRVTFLSRNQLQQLIESGGVLVNGQRAKSSTKLRKDDQVELTVPPPPSNETVPEEIPLDVLHEDEHLIVINKRPGIIVHPARSELSGTMINALAWRFQNLSGGALSEVGKEHARPGVVHRLDRDTTGCIVFAKNEEAHWKLGAQFEHRKVDKRYLAFARGAVEPGFDVIEQPIGPHPSREKGFREKQVVRHDDLGKPSITVCRVIERYRLHARPVGDQAFSLVELELKTGRTHQIRVHMSHIGFPLVGDDMYGGRKLELAGGGEFARQALHAALLAFEHPITGADMAFVAPLPDDMRALLETLRSEETTAVDAAGTVSRKRLGLD